MRADDDLLECDDYYTRAEYREGQEEEVKVDEDQEVVKAKPKSKSAARVLRQIIADPAESASDRQDARTLLDLEFVYPRQFRERFQEFVARRQSCKSSSTPARSRAGSNESTG